VKAIMRIVSQAADNVPSAFRTYQPPRIPIELRICCMWAATGLLLATLAFALGFEDAITQALAMAG
jgi:hypothetical protein